MEFHTPVLSDAVSEFLSVKPEGIYFDGTLGGGGHAEGILKRLTYGRLIACDRDAEAIRFATERLKPYGDKLSIIKNNFKNALKILASYGIEKIDGALLDLGISSRQIDDAERGFSYIRESRLDMRMDRDSALTAYDVINSYPKDKLADIIFRYGEETFARRIAARIALKRVVAPIETTAELNEIIRASMPAAAVAKAGHPSKKTYQAIRIAVNGELDGLDKAVRDLVSALNPGGRLVIISFHSLEDRIIKNTFRELAAGCICSKKMPVCTCGHEAEIKILTPHPITADAEELAKNPRSAPAKLRAVQKIE